MGLDMLKTTEAAVVARVEVGDVNRVIDEHILPEDFVSRDDGRFVAVDACALISFYFDSANSLTAEARLSAIREMAERLRRPHPNTLALLADVWTVHAAFLTIDLVPFVKRAMERLSRLRAAREMVVSDPGILSGTPVVRGTRVPVHDVAASVKAGVPRERILEAYPSLDADKIELAAIYAQANPVRGRPRELPKGARIVADRRVPRRRTAG